MGRLTLQEAEDLYLVPGWGDGYFSITGKGTLAVHPQGRGGPTIDMADVVQALRDEGAEMPVTVRFPQILRHRVDRLNHAFHRALKENGCKDVRYRGVFPIKVNQRKELVQELSRAGRRWAYGLEVGSKAELVAALAMDPNRKSLLVVNGFKDRQFLEAAFDAAHLKDELVIVMDEVGELDHILPLLEEREGPLPLLGIRLKLRSKAPGKWALSGGERAKFGLTIPELLHAVERLEEAGHADRIVMLHFHIGSQISDIRRIVQGVREAGRIHTELARMGVGLRYIDVGGGMAVDYDGSGSSGPNSANYTMEEYASSIVATLKDICDEAEVPMPGIINEAGRAVTAHHATLLIDVVREVPGMLPPVNGKPRDEDPTPLWNLYETRDRLNRKTVFECFHDAVQYREDLQALFDLGHLDLRSLGRADTLFRTIIAQVRRLLEAEEETDSEEYVEASLIENHKLVGNFSLFQSLPDVWGVKQQFPILPVDRLRDPPTRVASIADITCDSDGEIRRFIDPEGTRAGLPVHDWDPDVPYVLAACLVGAYQDTLGDYHNLFGETAEAWVVADEDGWKVRSVMRGSRVSDMLRWVRYDAADLRKRLRSRIRRMRDSGSISAESAERIVRRLTRLMDSSTYLNK